MDSDAEVVARVLAGDRARFGELVRRHERGVRAVAFAVLRDHDAALDVAQEAFLQAFQKLATLQDAAAFGGWVRAMARNRALTDARRRVKVTCLEAVERVACEAAAEPETDLPARLVEAVLQLPEHEQSVVMLHYFDDQDVRSISRITGRRVGTVTMQLFRARERLRGWLKELDDER